jgi:hypothetical protein
VGPPSLTFSLMAAFQSSFTPALPSHPESVIPPLLYPSRMLAFMPISHLGNVG